MSWEGCQYGTQSIRRGEISHAMPLALLVVPFTWPFSTGGHIVKFYNQGAFRDWGDCSRIYGRKVMG